MFSAVDVVNAPLGGPQAARAEQGAYGVGGGDLGVTGVEHHADIFSDGRGQRAVLHLTQQHNNTTQGYWVKQAS